MKIGKAGTSED